MQSASQPDRRLGLFDLCLQASLPQYVFRSIVILNNYVHIRAVSVLNFYPWPIVFFRLVCLSGYSGFDSLSFFVVSVVLYCI